MLADGRLWRIGFMNLFTLGTLLAVQGLWGGPYLADVHGLSPVTVGNLLVAMGIGVVLGNLGSGWLADRLGRRRVTLTAAAGFVVCQVLLATLPSGVPVAALAALYLAFGALASFGVVLLAHARATFPRSLTGRAITSVNLVGISGAMAVQWAMGAVIEAGREAGGAYGAGAYQPAFWFTTALGVAAWLLYAPIAAQADPATALGRMESP